ncbi:P-loop containing nucleoside triphosphate hydrolase protein [Truncatella angustata]|uniref:P-loop containing nucleoside triphosphate hydrolase protein n=1 Tax=Truncatella angustata TaxID=152316 RepID=A0A9P8ZSI4_9PEZI|nr:P-loop containing nucleoside triphosphate hydrolase protein [Truncatella angustata]KAH6648017.1 P-loop containing nucleoside triphosphate hydrolase protein [Truncatella angustata]
MSLKEFFFGFSDETRAAFPNLFINHNIDRHQCRRVVPMEVLSLGMGRTGTTSMAAAFALLGFPTSHGGADMHSNPLDGDIWLEAVKAKYQGDTSVKLDASFFDKALGHVSACADYPSNMFGPELIAAYPNAKVVLVERDADAWYPSFERALIRGQDLPAWFRHFLELADNTQKHVQPVIWRGMMQGQFGAKDSIEWRKKAKDVYKRHNAEIREVLKDQPERLLVYRLGSGWEPLCEFLGKPIPDVDFPRVNEKAQHDAMIKVFIVQQLQSFLLNMTKTGGAALVAVIAWRWWSQSPSA